MNDRSPDGRASGRRYEDGCPQCSGNVSIDGFVLSKHARNFGSTSDEIPELSFLLQLATELNVNLHVNWDKRFPDEWELDFIENRDAAPGSCSHVLRLLTEAADRHGKDIIGCVQNTFDSSLPPEPWLLEWYMNHGFHQIANEVHGVPIRRRRQQSSASVQATPPAG